MGKHCAVYAFGQACHVAILAEFKQQCRPRVILHNAAKKNSSGRQGRMLHLPERPSARKNLLLRPITIRTVSRRPSCCRMPRYGADPDSKCRLGLKHWPARGDGRLGSTSLIALRRTQRFVELRSRLGCGNHTSNTDPSSAGCELGASPKVSLSRSRSGVHSSLSNSSPYRL